MVSTSGRKRNQNTDTKLLKIKKIEREIENQIDN